jgi:hypothetical protein
MVLQSLLYSSQALTKNWQGPGLWPGGKHGLSVSYRSGFDPRLLRTRLRKKLAKFVELWMNQIKLVTYLSSIHPKESILVITSSHPTRPRRQQSISSKQSLPC